MPTSWGHEKTPPGYTGTGWIAGDVHVMYCHPSKASTPCHRVYFGESATCEKCGKGHEVAELGYMPLWRWDGKPVFVVLRDHQIDLAAAMQLHTYVTWVRAAGKGESVALSVAKDQRNWLSAYPAKNRPMNLAAFLPVLWKMPQYGPVCRDEFPLSDKPLSPVAGRPKQSAKDEIVAINERFAEETRGVIRRHLPVKTGNAEPLGAIIDPLLNGKHPTG